jgi:hypothetical protein
MKRKAPYVGVALLIYLAGIATHWSFAQRAACQAPSRQGAADLLGEMGEVARRFAEEDDEIHRMDVPQAEKEALWAAVRWRRAAAMRELRERRGPPLPRVGRWSADVKPRLVRAAAGAVPARGGARAAVLRLAAQPAPARPPA